MNNSRATLKILVLPQYTLAAMTSPVLLHGLLQKSLFFGHAFTHRNSRLSSGQGSRAGLCILMGGVGFRCPQIHVSIGCVGTAVQDAARLLEGLTHTIPIMHIAQAWFPCKETGGDPFTNQAPGTNTSSCPRRFAGHLALGFPTTWQVPSITPAADPRFTVMRCITPCFEKQHE